MGFLKRLRSDGVFLTHLDAAGTKDDQMLINILPQVAATSARIGYCRRVSGVSNVQRNARGVQEGH